MLIETFVALAVALVAALSGLALSIYKRKSDFHRTFSVIDYIFETESSDRLDGIIAMCRMRKLTLPSYEEDRSRIV